MANNLQFVGEEEMENGGSGAKEAPRVLKKMNRDVQGYDLIGRVIACIADGYRYVALVVGYKESKEAKGHLLYYFADQATEEDVDLSAREWELDFSMDLTALLAQRIVVMWPGEYAAGDEGDVITNGIIPFEAFVIRSANGEDKWRILYTYNSMFEDRNLADSESNWAAVETNEWNFKGLPIVTWSSKPRRLTPVVDEQLHWDRQAVSTQA